MTDPIKVAAASQQDNEDLLLRAVEQIIFVATKHPVLLWPLLDARDKQARGEKVEIDPDLARQYAEWHLAITGKRTKKKVFLLTPLATKAVELLFQPVPHVGVRIVLPPRKTDFSKRLRHAFERGLEQGGEPQRLRPPHRIIFPGEDL